MGGDYEEVKKETKQAIVNFMTSITSQEQGVATTTITISKSTLQVSIVTDTMQVDSTRITLDTLEDPIKDFGIHFDNLVSYTSLENEDEKEENKNKK